MDGADPQILPGLNLSCMRISGKRDVCQSSKNDSIPVETSHNRSNKHNAYAIWQHAREF